MSLLNSGLLSAMSSITGAPCMYRPPPPVYPPVTVFVGNIAPRAPDAMVRAILAACGSVTSWKRVSAFGFCEFGSPEAGLRCVRLLHDRDIGGKKLVVRVDAKTTTLLEQYKNDQRGKMAPDDAPKPSETDYLDAEQRELDVTILTQVQQLLDDYAVEMNNYEAIQLEEQMEKRNRILQEAAIEEEKHDMIHREIGKFREVMKQQEEAREMSRRKKETDESVSDTKREKRSDRERSARHKDKENDKTDKDKDRRKRRRSKTRSRERDRHREQRDREREIERQREKDREHERAKQLEREKEKALKREKERAEIEREREREKEREREAAVKASSAGLRSDSKLERELEEEARDRKRAEKRAREKEASYQNRLRIWETRERRKAKEYEKDREKLRAKEESKEKEAIKLKEFLQDYDDFDDDPKFFRRDDLQRRLQYRLREAESDRMDKEQEKKELEELMAEVYNSSSVNPAEEFEKKKREREELYKPRLIIPAKQNLEIENVEEIPEEKQQSPCVRQEEAQIEHLSDSSCGATSDVSAPAPSEDTASLTPVQTWHDNNSPVIDDGSYTPPPVETASDHSNKSPISISLNIKQNHLPIVQSLTTESDDRAKWRRLQVFNDEDDDDNSVVEKRRPLIPHEDTTSKVTQSKPKSLEEKKREVKKLIERIPTQKDALFAYKLESMHIDATLMEKRVRPWVAKKIVEYIGEPEPTLVDFICSKVSASSSPQGILNDVLMVLDEEAEVFVVKLWRLLIYEVEAKKLGLVK